MEYENDERGYGAGENLSNISTTDSRLASETQAQRDQSTRARPRVHFSLPVLAGNATNNRRTDDRAYDRDDDRDVRDLRDDRRGDEDARARSASPDGRERMDTR